MNSDDRLFVCEAHGGPANGRHIHVPADPTDPDLPAASTVVQVDNLTEARIVRAQYVRAEISDTSHQWIFRPAAP